MSRGAAASEGEPDVWDGVRMGKWVTRGTGVRRKG